MESVKGFFGLGLHKFFGVCPLLWARRVYKKIVVIHLWFSEAYLWFNFYIFLHTASSRANMVVANGKSRKEYRREEENIAESG